jgi:hypothetical protein
MHHRVRPGRDPMQIGAVTLYPGYPRQAGRLWIDLADDQSRTTWTVAGAKAAVAYLQAWIAEQEAGERDP